MWKEPLAFSKKYDKICTRLAFLYIINEKVNKTGGYV